MSEHAEPRALRRAARQAEGRPFFVASALSQYRALHDADDEEIAALLSCARRRLPFLALCRRPDSFAPSFATDVERIAAYVGLDSLQLMKLLREVDAMRALQSMRTSDVSSMRRGFLMAARDRAAEQAPPADSGEPQTDVGQTDEDDE